MRRAVRAVRDAIPAQQREEAAQLVAAGALDSLATPLNIAAGYYPIHSEFNSLPLLARLATQVWRTALPAVPEGGPLDFRLWAPGDPLREGRHRIPEPAADALAIRPTMMLVPLLAFDARGGRLGYGRGHYDITLAGFRGGGYPVTAIGLAFDEQEVAEVPTSPLDERLDWILTPSGLRSCADSGPR